LAQLLDLKSIDQGARNSADKETVSQVLPVKLGQIALDCVANIGADVQPTTGFEHFMLIWNKDFETGSPLVDTQHRMLIEKINELGKMLQGPPPSKATVDQFLEFLASYVKVHFTFEERCMDQHQCPVREQNKNAHAAFLAFYQDFSKQYLVAGPKPELLHSLQKMASDWIVNHILTVDTKLNACLKN
jgi:hemerythrin